MTMQMNLIKSQLLQGHNMEELIASARRIVEKDEDEYFSKQIDFFIKAFGIDHPKFLMMIEDNVENCLDLQMKHSMDRFAQEQEFTRRTGMDKPKRFVGKMPRAITRTSGRLSAITYTHSCHGCHDELTGTLDGCHCVNLDTAVRHDNFYDEDAHRRTCVVRFGERS